MHALMLCLCIGHECWRALNPNVVLQLNDYPNNQETPKIATVIALFEPVYTVYLLIALFNPLTRIAAIFVLTLSAVLTILTLKQLLPRKPYVVTLDALLTIAVLSTALLSVTNEEGV